MRSKIRPALVIYSRAALRAALVMLLAVIAEGCGERAPENSPSLANQGCLNEASRTIQEYFHGEVSEQDLNSFWDCIDNALKLFTDRTRGVEPGKYKPTELRRFL